MAHMLFVFVSRTLNATVFSALLQNNTVWVCKVGSSVILRSAESQDVIPEATPWKIKALFNSYAALDNIIRCFSLLFEVFCHWLHVVRALAQVSDHLVNRAHVFRVGIEVCVPCMSRRSSLRATKQQGSFSAARSKPGKLKVLHKKMLK